MSRSLSVFMAPNVVSEEIVKIVASKRIKDEKGNPVEWDLVAIDSELDKQIRKSCMKRIPVPGKRRMTRDELDFDLYTTRLVCACVAYPDLKNVELQASYGVMGEDQLIHKMLRPGEFIGLLNKVEEITCFDPDMEELVEEGKN